MINILFCGDTLINKDSIIPEYFKKVIKNSDFSVCNFEAPIKKPSIKKYVKAGPNLKQNSNSIIYLKKLGFNILTLSNNHIFDYGLDSINYTINEIRENELIDFGFYFENEKIKPLRLKKNGLTVSLICCGENTEGCQKFNNNTFGYLWTNSKKVKRLIKKEKQKCDYVFVSTHAGLEGINFPIKQWKKRYKKFIKYGADVVIGHHPHVAQGIEKFEKGLIFYSLGNFIFDYPLESIETLPSLSVEFNLTEESISYNLFYHKKCRDELILLEDSNEIEKNLKNKLEDNSENNIAKNAIIIERFNTFKKYIKIYVFGLSSFNPRNILKYFFYFFCHKKYFNVKRYKLFEHLLIIDTNRYLIKEYFKLQKLIIKDKTRRR